MHHLWNARILAAGALILELVFDVVTVTAGHHRQLGMHQRSFPSVQLPEGPVAVPHAIDHPGGGVTHLMDECVPEAICTSKPASQRLRCTHTAAARHYGLTEGELIPEESQTLSDSSMRA